MKQVIRWLRMGLAAPTKTERQWLGITPLDRPTDDDAIRRVVLLLEAVERGYTERHYHESLIGLEDELEFTVEAEMKIIAAALELRKP